MAAAQPCICPSNPSRSCGLAQPARYRITVLIRWVAGPPAAPGIANDARHDFCVGRPGQRRRYAPACSDVHRQTVVIRQPCATAGRNFYLHHDSSGLGGGSDLLRCCMQAKAPRSALRWAAAGGSLRAAFCTRCLRPVSSPQPPRTASRCRFPLLAAALTLTLILTLTLTQTLIRPPRTASRRGSAPAAAQPSARSARCAFVSMHGCVTPRSAFFPCWMPMSYCSADVAAAIPHDHVEHISHFAVSH